VSRHLRHRVRLRHDNVDAMNFLFVDVTDARREIRRARRERVDN